MIEFKHSGNFNNFQKFLLKASRNNHMLVLEKYGQLGVEALSAATPLESGETASSWSFEIERGTNQTAIRWINSNTNQGVNIAIILQYGHGTNGGGYVEGIDYINPAMKPIFDSMADELWKEVAG